MLQLRLVRVQGEFLMRLVLFAASMLALAACQPKETAATSAAAKEAAQAEASGQDAAGAPSPPQPAAKPVSFDAFSKTAEAVTGPIKLTPLGQVGPNSAPAMRISAANASLYETTLVPDAAENAKSVDWSKVFSAKISFDPAAPADVPSVELHQVNVETISPDAPNGGFCGKDKTDYIAIASPVPQPGGQGSMLSIAAFKGAAWPPKDTSGLCGVYNYASPH